MLFNKVELDPGIEYSKTERFIYQYVMNCKLLARFLKLITNRAKWINFSCLGYKVELRVCDNFIRDAKISKNGYSIVEL